MRCLIRCCLSVGLLAAGAIVGCEKKTVQQKPPAAVVPAGFVLGAAPEDAKDLAAVRATAKEGDVLVVKAVVGGVAEPFTASQAVMQVIDPSVLTCDKMGMKKDECPTPWDACCHQADVKEKNATVRVLSADGKPLTGTLEGIGGIAPGKPLIVKGKAHLEAGTLFIDATNVYVK